MIVQDVITHLEALAPLAYAEEFDNVGLLVGDKTTKVTGILVTLDTLEAVVDEAIETHCNLIVSFHPIIFKGLKKITCVVHKTLLPDDGVTLVLKYPWRRPHLVWLH